MHPTSHPSHPLSADRRADALLGPHHPFVLVSDRLDVLAEQSLVIAAVLSVSIFLLVAGLSGAVWLVLASAVAQVRFACVFALVAERKHELVLNLIIQGRGDLPLVAIERQRRRILGQEHREQLAQWLDAVRREAEHPIQRPAFARPMYSARVIAAVAPDLAEIARLLRSDDPGLRGVARTQRLLSDGTSALYGQEIDALHQEVRGIRFLLES
jgi:hypothetical protein